MPQPWTWVKVTRKVIQYISLDSYILCAKYLRFIWNGFDARGKVVAAADAAADVVAADAADVAEMNWKHKITPDWGDLKIITTNDNYSGIGYQ